MRVLSEEKLRKLSAFIKQYARENDGAAPGLKDIMNYMNMVKSTAFRYIMELVKRGEVFYSGKNTLESSLQRKMKVASRKVVDNKKLRIRGLSVIYDINIKTSALMPKHAFCNR